MDESDLEKLFGVETLSDIKQLVERGKTDDVVSFKVVSFHQRYSD